MNLRWKMALGFAGILAIIAGIGVHNIGRIDVLGDSIEVILSENYRSVVACQQMKEAIDRLDSGAVFVLLGAEEKGNEQIGQQKPLFEKALRVELGNLTLPGEKEKALLLERLYFRYKDALGVMADPAVGREARRKKYFDELQPLFLRIKETAGAIERMNQQSMMDRDAHAKREAEIARRQVYLMLASSTLAAALFLFLTGSWILRPIKRLIYSADEIRKGNLDLVVRSGSGDEIGQLSEAFNEMAASLREFRRSDQSRLLRIQRSTQQAFDSLPDAIAVLTAEGEVEVSTTAAVEAFGLKPGMKVRDSAYPWLAELANAALARRRPAEGEGAHAVIQRFVDNEERFYRPKSVPILDSSREPAGVVLVLRDITQQRHQDEMKRGVIDAVSHQLMTPLTSIRMALHLLYEEKVGGLTPKQSELVVAAGEDAERLQRIVEDLLDIGRLESGRTRLELAPVSPQEILSSEAEFFRSMARDRGVSLSFDVPPGLPAVSADRSRIAHVVSNFLSNAIKYTPPGGTVTLSAGEEAQFVRFSVADTGGGIPERFLGRVFDPFFRVPGQARETGVGLGLAIARDIVTAHGGTVKAESREGAGSVFSFTLPKASSPSPAGGES